MAHTLMGSHSFTCTPRIRHQELNPDMVNHPSTNRARCTLTSLIEIRDQRATAMPDHQSQHSTHYTSFWRPVFSGNQ